MEHVVVGPSVLVLAPELPQPPSVLICCDRCSLIIENAKVKSFLSCFVWCLSLRPWLSEAACLGPLDPNGSSVLLREKGEGFKSLYTVETEKREPLYHAIDIRSLAHSSLLVVIMHSISCGHNAAALQLAHYSVRDIFNEVPSSDGAHMHGIIICHM